GLKHSQPCLLFYRPSNCDELPELVMGYAQGYKTYHLCYGYIVAYHMA
ncbi:hypothetical protein LCGC14_2704480, partial [marine sediment metagenome]